MLLVGYMIALGIVSASYYPEKISWKNVGFILFMTLLGWVTVGLAIGFIINTLDKDREHKCNTSTA